MDTPRVSVILPTYNRLPQLKQVLNGLEKQTYPLSKFEVVVVSDGSGDGTNEFLQMADTPLQLVSVMQVNQGVAVARNEGVAHAQGDLVLFIDDDVVPTPQLIVEHLRLHDANTDDIVVLGPMLTPLDSTLSPWTQWEQDMLVKQYEAMTAGEWEPTARQFYTGNSSLARRLILDCGGFDPAFRRAEDVELAYRLDDRGIRFLFNERAVGYHYVARSFGSWMATPYAYGRNDVIFSVQKGQDWLLPTIFREYETRHKFIKALVWLCLDRPLLSKMLIMMLRVATWLAPSLSRMAFSGIFNLRYYQGMADELNGRSAFYEALTNANRKS
ncbi:MAG: glycosyltransferase family 2 protein [Chloroflexi bacterium]|nr:glycosyltransferase family 2 protein [Chloroflexota bacterium]